MLDGDRKVAYVDDNVVAGESNVGSTMMVGELDSEKERALVWKFDMRILPTLAIMYLFNALDKSNLGMSHRRESFLLPQSSMPTDCVQVTRRRMDWKTIWG